MPRPALKKIILTSLVLLLLFPAAAFAEQLSVEIPEERHFAGDDSSMFAAPYPVAYGEENFRDRILERTQGKRDPIGLVLSGGSARAMAHVGVLKYMEEQGIVPDFIVSNSMGSIVGLMYSAGFSPEQIEQILTEIRLDGLFDFVLPLQGGLLSLSRFSSLLAAYLGTDTRIEELSIPIMIITEDMVTKRQVHIMEGDFATVLAASFAIPVYFDPVEYQGHLLIDGGITNLVPLSTAYAYSDTVIVATSFYDVDTLNLRSPLTALNVSLDIGKRRTGMKELYTYSDSAIWIRPDVEKVSFMEFSKAPELIQKGYEAASARSEVLAPLGRKSLSPALLHDVRGERERDIVRIRKQMLPFNHTRAIKPVGTVGIGFESQGYRGSGRFLREDTLVGLEYKLRSGNTITSVIGGGAWYPHAKGEKLTALLNGRFEYYPLSFLRLSLETMGQLAHASPLLADFFFAGDVTARFVPRTGLSVSVTGEAEASLPLARAIRPERELLASAGVMVSYWTPGVLHKPLDISMKYQGYSVGDSVQMRSFALVDAETSLAWGSHMTFDVAVSARFALDGQKNVPYFARDGYRTSSRSILRQGREAGHMGTENYLIVSSFYAGIVPFSVNPSVGELVLFDTPRMGPYVDLLWNAGLKPAISVGFKLDTTLKIVGLKEFPIEIYVGYDSAADTQELGGSVVWGVFFKF